MFFYTGVSDHTESELSPVYNTRVPFSLNKTSSAHIGLGSLYAVIKMHYFWEGGKESTNKLSALVYFLYMSILNY